MTRWEFRLNKHYKPDHIIFRILCNYLPKPTSMKKLLLVVALFLVTMTTFAHTWEIRVNQNQDGSLTWYIQSYHTIGETACTTEAYKSGLIINGVTYPIQSVHTGDISTLSPTVFGRNTSCGTARNILVLSIHLFWVIL